MGWFCAIRICQDCRSDPFESATLAKRAEAMPRFSDQPIAEENSACSMSRLVAPIMDDGLAALSVETQNSRLVFLLSAICSASASRRMTLVSSMARIE